MISWLCPNFQSLKQFDILQGILEIWIESISLSLFHPLSVARGCYRKQQTSTSLRWLRESSTNYKAHSTPVTSFPSRITPIRQPTTKAQSLPIRSYRCDYCNYLSLQALWDQSPLPLWILSSNIFADISPPVTTTWKMNRINFEDYKIIYKKLFYTFSRSIDRAGDTPTWKSRSQVLCLILEYVTLIFRAKHDKDWSIWRASEIQKQVKPDVEFFCWVIDLRSRSRESILQGVINEG